MAAQIEIGNLDCICPKFQQLKWTSNTLQSGPAALRRYTDCTMQAWLQHLLTLLALPEYGLSTVFVISFISATLLPLGSEPAVFGLVKLNPDLFWPAVLIATAGNTLGGAVSWWMGWGAHKAVDRVRHSATHLKALEWLEKLGPKACLLAWLPGVGDPLCAVAGWLKLPFWSCVGYMAIGKLARYVVMTGGLIWVFPGQLPTLG